MLCRANDAITANLLTVVTVVLCARSCRGDSTAPYEPLPGPVRGLRLSDRVHMCKLGVLLHMMRGDNAWYDDLSVGARLVLCVGNRTVAAPGMDNR